MKIAYDQLILEVTRRCNMACKHCLRGKAENMDMPKAIVEKALSSAESVASITFSGGEPTLNVPVIKYTLDYCKSHNIPVYGFYVVTNGKVVSNDFLHAAVDWFLYCIECNGYFDEEIFYTCGVALSQDIFHEEIDESNLNKLRVLSFFHEDDKKIDWDKISLINEGKAQILSDNAFKKRALSGYEFDAEAVENNIQINSQIYVSANGDVRTCCDTAYDNDNFTIGNLNGESMESIICSRYAESEVEIAS